ncbi:uncharacterized protein EV420DRAFT_1565518 [Desarmillaria tabescens]|uniref:Uncharacterized protein n=1 Tax=Armillaria tabescens TaxID=1929756 RepID=A0AA39JUJ4_ARMTA|nr:uncharacterized protein EV420DRAFT_1565518 [Desarmillaria tabescens]KAK0449024.1 hypothetical protein EV420DRAFT_1565518 [Desarmillaria tabescens]
MATPTEIPQLTGSERALVFEVLDALLNSATLLAFMHGMYTCILAGTLWIIFASQRSTNAGRRTMIILVIAIYFLTTIIFASNWFLQRNASITHGENFWTTFLLYDSPNRVEEIMICLRGIPAGIATLLADSALIWRCWVVWGRRWIIVLIPILCYSRYWPMYYSVITQVDNLDDTKNWTLIYESCTLATTLLSGAKHGGAGAQAYRGVVEVIVESASLYTVSLIIDLILVARQSPADSYSDGIAPTLIVARVASGHARPDDSWNGSVMSSLHFGSRAHSAEDMTRSVVLAEENVLEPDDGRSTLQSESRI